MDKYFKRIVSFVVALTILVVSFLGGTINSYAGSVDFDDEKFTFTYGRPYIFGAPTYVKMDSDDTEASVPCISERGCALRQQRHSASEADSG